jgi:hypothetical protein
MRRKTDGDYGGFGGVLAERVEGRAGQCAGGIRNMNGRKSLGHKICNQDECNLL